MITQQVNLRSSPILEREFCISDNSCEEKYDNSSFPEAEDHIKKGKYSSTKIAAKKESCKYLLINSKQPN